MSKEVKIGDVVKLRSGNMPMTVTEVWMNDEDEDDSVDLVWHDLNGQMCEADRIPVACLVSVST